MKKDKSYYIRSTPLNLKDVNMEKRKILRVFLEAYRSAVKSYIDFYWGKHNLDGSYSILDLDNYNRYPYNPKFDSILSGRALKCAATQAMGMINASTKKQQKRMFALRMLQSDPNADPKHISKLQSKIDRTKLIRPSVPKKMKAELNSINLKMEESDGHFDFAFNLSSMFNMEFKKAFLPKNKIVLLANAHRRYRHWEKYNGSERLNSFLVSSSEIHIRFKVDKIPKKEEGKTLGIDQGVTTLFSIAQSDSDARIQSQPCNHNHDLGSILKKLDSKKKGSKARRRAEQHRKNHINWAANQIGLSEVREVRLEHLKNVGHGQVTSSYLRGWTHALIQDKLQSRCEETDVLFSLQSAPYRSQRCSCCGYVHSSNRTKKLFICRKCGYTEDADTNAAANHLVDLPDLNREDFKGLKINRSSGFYWNPEFDGAYSPV